MADDVTGLGKETMERLVPADRIDRSHPPFHHGVPVRVSFTGTYYAGAFMGSHIVDADEHHRCTVPPDSVALLPDLETDAEALVDQTQMKGLSIKDGMASLELLPPHELVVAWVDAARAMLGDAPNYSETRIDFPREKAEMEVSAAGEYERFVFTVQRAGKVTPHEARQKAEAERDQAVALCTNLQATLLSRLAELTEAAEKARSTEWLRACATLPPAEWPPAPGYKGPMVPAADLALALWLLAEDQYFREWTLKAAELELKSHGEAEGKLETALREQVAERDALQARLDAGNLIVSRAIDEGLPADEALRMLDRVLAGKTARALQGDQPPEPDPEVFKLGWKPNGLGGWDRTCTCEPDCCLGEGDLPNRCDHCATIDGELPCPVADAEPTEPGARS